MLIYCKEHRTITSRRPIDAPKWCCEVAAFKRENERNMSVVWNAISPYIASEDVVYGEGPMTDLCETVLTKMWDALLTAEEQEK